MVCRRRQREHRDEASDQSGEYRFHRHLRVCAEIVQQRAAGRKPWCYGELPAGAHTTHTWNDREIEPIARPSTATGSVSGMLIGTTTTAHPALVFSSGRTGLDWNTVMFRKSPENPPPVATCPADGQVT